MQPPEFNPYAAPHAPPTAADADLGFPLMPASRSARFVATVIDQALVFVPAVLARVLAEPRSRGIHSLSVAVPLVAVGMAIELVCQVGWRQSVGKRLLGLQVVTLDGHPASLARVVFLRNVPLHVLGFLCGLVGFADALAIFRDNERCLHDELAGTRVVRKR